MIDRRDLVVFVAGILGVLAAVPVFWSPLFDDAFIHARIVENFLASGAPVFNLGDTFKASSSTGYILLLTVASYWTDTILGVRLLMAIALVTVFVLGSLLLRRVEGPWALSTFVLLSSVPFVMIAAYGGMESPIFVALLLGSALAFSFNRRGLALALIAVSVWFRFEAVLLLGVASLWIVAQGGRLTTLLHAWPVVVLVVVDTFLFGTIVPNAAGVKSQVYGHSLGDSVKTALEFGTGRLWTGLLLVSLLISEAIRILRTRDLGGYQNIFFAFSLGVLCAWMISSSNLFEWYFPIVYVPFAIGLCCMPLASRTLVFRAFVLLTAGGYLAFGAQSVARSIDPSEFSPNDRATSYLRIGTALYEYCPTCSLATSEIGGLGYGFKGIVYDGLGLADPLAMQFHPMRVPEERSSEGIGAIPPDYIALRDPDFIVSMAIFTQALRASDLLKAYSRYSCSFSADGASSLWGDTGVEIYSKTPLPVSVLERMECPK